MAGQIVDANKHSLANVKVHAVVHKLTDDPMRLFDWGMLNSGQLAYHPPIIDIQDTVSDAKGYFQFNGIPSGFAIDLMFQGEGVPKTRREHIEKLSLAERTQMIIELPKAATVTGKINTEVYPNVTSLSVYRQGDGFSRRKINIGPNQTTYAFTDLDAGTYVLTIHGKMQAGTIEGRFSFPKIGKVTFDIETGEDKRMDIGYSVPMPLF